MGGTEILFRRDFQLERSIRDSMDLPKFDSELYHLLFSSRASHKEAHGLYGFAWERPVLRTWLMDSAGVKPDSGSFDDLSPENLAAREKAAIREALQVAIDALGLESVRWMCILYAMRGLYAAGDQTADALWRDAYHTGVTARWLAEKLGRDDGEILGMAGLMHDIGKLMLLVNHPLEYPAHFANCEVGGASNLRQEVVRFHYTHTVLGTVVCRHWKMPVQVNIAARFHHGWTLEVPIKDSYLEIVALVAWASQIAHRHAGHTVDLPPVVEEALEKKMSLPGNKRKTLAAEAAPALAGLKDVPC